ncbi:unnamed protein product [Dicrocoelium dendriticum]|nr:unnamed protein product [Dicrocoelium dendriticum]
MKGVVNPASTESDHKPSVNYLSSFLFGQKKDDVVFIRMNTPTQLEKEYRFGPILGEGTFGIVYSGVRIKDNAKCAIKKIERERTYSASERARLDREISILRLVKHPGIIELLAVAESPSYLFLITELCEGDTLADCLDRLPNSTGLEEYVAVEIVRQVAAALSYLHNRGIVHRDLKAGNIMLLHKVHLDYRPISLDKTMNQRHALNGKYASNPTANRSLPQGASWTSPTVPVITDVEVTQSARQMRYTNIDSSVRSKASRTSTKHAASSAAPVTLSSEDKGHKSHPLKSMEGGPGKMAPTEYMQHPRSPPPSLRTKLIDFGLAIEVRKNEEPLGNACGTPLYMAPEVLSGRSYTRQCDVWSLGILVYQLLNCQLPYNAQTEEQLLEQMNRFDIKILTRKMKHLSPPALNCLSRVLHLDPAYRYSASELLLDPWITQYAVVHRDEITFEHLDRKHSSVDGQTDASGRASSNVFPLDPTFSKTINPTGSRPPSVGFAHSSSTYSATNVLELMKQYHKELTSNKQDSTEHTIKSNTTE